MLYACLRNVGCALFAVNIDATTKSWKIPTLFASSATIIILLASEFLMFGGLTAPRVLSPSITVKQAVRVILSSMPINAAFP